MSFSERIAQVCDPVEQCPVCGSPERAPDVPQKKNRYSEELAALLETDEEELLRAIQCVRCRDCGLGYKNWWFKPEVYYRVFVESAPMHPRGWDAVSGKYTPEQFVREVELLRSALDCNDPPLIAWRRRTVQSYLDNIPPAQRREPATAQVLDRLRSIDLSRATAAELELLIDQVAPLIRRPKAYGRFAGFNTDELAQLVARHAPSLESYAELGCPLWGLLPRLAASGTQTLVLEDEDRAFWGGGCRDETGHNCFCYAADILGVDQLTSLTALAAAGRRVDMLAVLNYLDHLRSPLDLLRRAAAVSDRLLIVLVPDVPDEPGVIQHHTAFNEGVFDHVARALDLRVSEILACGEDAEPEFIAYLLAR